MYVWLLVCLFFANPATTPALKPLEDHNADISRNSLDSAFQNRPEARHQEHAGNMRRTLARGAETSPASEMWLIRGARQNSRRIARSRLSPWSPEHLGREMRCKTAWGVLLLFWESYSVPFSALLRGAELKTFNSRLCWMISLVIGSLDPDLVTK